MEEAKKILLLYKSEYKEVEKLRAKIRDIEENLTPTIRNDLPPARSYNGSPTEKAAVTLADLKTSYINKSIRAEMLRQKICDLLDKMESPTNNELLFARYMLLLPWKEVIKRLDILRPGKEYELKSVMGYKHKSALNEFQTILNTTPDKRKEEIYELARIDNTRSN